MEKTAINTVYVVTEIAYYIETKLHTIKVDSVWYREDEAMEYCNTLNSDQNTYGIHKFWKYEEIPIQ